jgi:DNA-binding transcriptional MerR regulator
VAYVRTVSDVAALTGVTVRALHHYDELGLLRPSARSQAGYRLYSHADLERLQEILVWRALDAALDAQRTGTRQQEATMFDGFDAARYEEEVRERWGHTEAYRESARRSATYGDAEWGEIRAEADEIVHAFAAVRGDGEPADSERARAVAERHRRHISRWFYDCQPAIHRGLGEMYVADERFARTYEAVAPGLAVYVRDAIAANADAHESATR